MSETTLTKDFWSRVDKSDAYGCWPWTGATTRGYGRCSRAFGTVNAHRAAWMITNGPIEDDLVVDHLCRNRACCNPLHMRVVTDGVNVLAGVGPTAVNAQKLACPRGHRYVVNVPKTAKVKRAPYRVCRECQKLLKRKYRKLADPVIAKEKRRIRAITERLKRRAKRSIQESI